MPNTVNGTTDPEAIGRRLADLRTARGLSQRQLAGDGCNSAYVSVLEKGTRSPSLDTLEYLAGRLATSARYLATGQLEPWQEGLDDAGLDAGDLTEHEREVLDRTLDDAARHAANIVGQTILEQRIEVARQAFRSGAPMTAACEQARAPLATLHERLTAGDHAAHEHAFERLATDALEGGDRA